MKKTFSYTNYFKLFAIAALVLILFWTLLETCHAATVYFPLTNWDGTTSTNRIKITPVGDSPLVNGSYLVIGPSKWLTPTNGTCTNNFVAGNFKLDVDGLSWPLPTYFAVPNSSFTYNITNLIISGGTVWHYTPGVFSVRGTNGFVVTPANGKGDILIDGSISGNAVAAGTNVTTLTNGSLITVNSQTDTNVSKSLAITALGTNNSTFVGANTFAGLTTFGGQTTLGPTYGSSANTWGGVNTFTNSIISQAITNSGNIQSATFTGGSFTGTHSGDGSALTSLNASQLTSGTLPDARLNHPNVFTTNSVGANGVLNAPVGVSAYSNSFVRLMSVQGGGVATTDMEAFGAPDYVGQLGLSWPGSKEMTIWAGAATSTGSNGWNRAGWNLLSGIHQIGDITRMPANSSPGINIYQNGNSEYSRIFYATNAPSSRNGSYITIHNLNPFTDGSGFYIPMYGTSAVGNAVLTNNDGTKIYVQDQFGLTIATVPGSYVVGETNMAGGYLILAGVGNSKPLYICCNAQVGSEPALGQKAWIGFDNRFLANSSSPGGTHFQAWIPGVYAFTNAGNKDVLYVEQAVGGTGMRVECLTNFYVKTGNLWATNYGKINAFTTGPWIDTSKGFGIECNTNTSFHWNSAEQSKGATWSFDHYQNYRFAIMQKFGQFPKLVHGSTAPFAIARSDNSDLQTDQSAQTLTDEIQVDSSGNISLVGPVAHNNTTYLAGAVTVSNKLTVDAAHTIAATNVGASKLVGTDAAGQLTNLVVGSGLTLSGGQLSATGSSQWNITGNSGLSGTANFIGNTDAADFVVRVDNVQQARFQTQGGSPKGNAVIGQDSNTNVITTTGVYGNFIGGGDDNAITNGKNSFIIGGNQNRVWGGGPAAHSGIVGGLANKMVAGVNGRDVIIGGNLNTNAGGQDSTILGGTQNYTSGTRDIVGGNLAQATHNDNFMWADSQASAFPSTGADRFMVRAQGGSWFSSGAVNAQAGVNIAGANGELWSQNYASESLVLSLASATTDTSANLLPANSIIEAVVWRITSTITSVTSFKIGDATIANRFQDTSSTLTAGTTGVGLQHVDLTGTSGPKQTSAAKVRVTVSGGAGIAGNGTIRITVFYRTFTPPTS